MFHTRTAATGKAPSPYVTSLVRRPNPRHGKHKIGTIPAATDAHSSLPRVVPAATCRRNLGHETRGTTCQGGAGGQTFYEERE